MSELNDRILEAVQESSARIDDYGQRSAIGMARSWIDSGKPIEREINLADKYTARDDLAEALVTIMEGFDASRQEQVNALAVAREWVNAPFLDSTMNGQRDKGNLLRPGDAAKAAQ